MAEKPHQKASSVCWNYSRQTFEEDKTVENIFRVDEIFTLSLSHLCNPHNRGYTHFRTGDKYGYTLPVFRNGKHRVWGLTAVALDHTLKLIVP